MENSNSASLGLAMSPASIDVDDDASSSLLSTETSSLNFKQKAEEILHSIKFRAMICFQILAYGSYSVLVHLCEKDGVITFSSTAMNFILEVVKLIFSFSALIYSSQMKLNIFPNIHQLIICFRQSLPYSIPGILYFITNNLAVHIQLYMDPASYQILANFKILTTAILYRLIIKQKLTRQQWFALLLLFFGGLSYSLGKTNSFHIPLISFHLHRYTKKFFICFKKSYININNYASNVCTSIRYTIDCYLLYIKWFSWCL